ncbi:MAG: hypothetical protein IIA77_06175 [Proteobacteria bacterium]|nr:hypothetical protein [Pseudomonadota bacterium]
MDVIEMDLCIVNRFRLTKYKVFNGDDIVDTYFSIRDEQGTVLGRNYDDVEEPLKMMLNMCTICLTSYKQKPRHKDGV